MYAMTAAHRTLPLSSYAEVTNLKNNRSVIVRINDRGPYHGNRVMDLSYAAAKELGIQQKGTGSVKITPLAL
jgi:rare lipoprotein A